MTDLFAKSSAVLSSCGTFRWRLDRHVGAGDTVAAVFGVNPSTANAVLDNPTIQKWRGFGMRLGWHRFMVGNVFSYRATDVKILASVDDLFGPEHEEHLQQIIGEADVLVACWGNRNKLPRPLWHHIEAMLLRLQRTGKPVYCWGRTSSGDPRHPGRIAYDTPLEAMLPERG